MGRFFIPNIGEPISWESLEESPFRPEINAMLNAEQEPDWRAKGNVWNHTKLVLERLIESDEWKNFDEYLRSALFVEALLHDLGKTLCSRIEDGRIISPNHSSIGARNARTLLWKRFNLAGTEEKRSFRELVCTLIKYHSKPPHFDCGEVAYYNLLAVSSEGHLIKGFSNRLLSTLVEADLRGRVSPRIQSALEILELYREGARECECFEKPYSFASDFSRRAFFARRIDSPRIDLYDDTWGEIILTSGLPGVGKDAFIKRNLSFLPVVSLDDIRSSLNLSPIGPQDAGLQIARDKAKVLLRAREPFVWNSANVAPFFRDPLANLCEAYGASVRIIYLETPWDEELRRNAKRDSTVPRSVIERYLTKLEPPTPREARRVDWFIV